MNTLTALFRYNAWAGQRVFAVIAALDQHLLTENARGTFGSVEQTFKHMIGVEDVYLALVQQRDLATLGTQEAYFTHDLAWFGNRATVLGRGYLDLLSNADESTLERAVTVPWLGISPTIHDSLIQVLTHSAHHRVQVLSSLGNRGQRMPDLDYVIMLQEAAT